MAEVYKAWDRKRSVHVAIKLLNEDLAEDTVFLHRFAREARAIEILQHPHIVRFFGFEEMGRLAFLVMEYINGSNLRAQLKLLGRPLTLPEALTVVEPVCSALHYAHQMGIFHCDVKPANIFIERGGRVVLADFGIARLTESATVTFSTPGTPAYMSPEQCRGREDLDARTDVYSLGITAYEMLTRDRPFKGDTEGTTGSRGERVRWEQMHLPPPPPRSVNPHIAPAAEAAILRALEKEPGRRQQGALEFYRDLSEGGAVQLTSGLPWVEELKVHPPEPPKPRPSAPSGAQQEIVEVGRRLPMGMGVVVGGIGMVLLVVLLLALIGLSRDDGGNEVAMLAAQLTADVATNIAQAIASTGTPLPPMDTPIPTSFTPIWTPSPMPPPTLTPTPPPPAITPQPTLRWTDIGQSVQGRDLSVAIAGYENGSSVVIVGSIQGDQPNTRDLISNLIGDFDRARDRIPANVAFHFIPTINPDGNAAGTRRNAHNVDLNRNWDTFDWTANPEQPGGTVRGAGGSRPHSEPETQDLANYLLALKRQNPNLWVVLWHSSQRLSSGGHVYPGYTSSGLDRDAVSLAGRYAHVTGYAVKEDWAPYETTGELITWCAEEGIEAIDIVIPRSLSGSNSNLRHTTMEALLEIARFP